MSGRIFVIGLLSFAAVFGAVLYFFQTRAYYEPVLLEPSLPQLSTIVPSAVVPNETAVQSAEVADGTPNATTPAALNDTQIASLPDIDTTPAAEIAPYRTGQVRIRMTRFIDGQAEAILLKNFQGIDANTSPLRFKGCFTSVNSIPFLTETYQIYDNATPLGGPSWFECYDVEEITDELDTGAAIAFLGERNIKPGVDRVIAVLSDHRAFVWHQFNDCGQAAYSGETAPAGCAPQADK